MASSASLAYDFFRFVSRPQYAQLLPDGSRKQQETASLKREQIILFLKHHSAQRTFPSNAAKNQPVLSWIVFPSPNA